MRMKALAVLSALAAASCVRGVARPDPVPPPSAAQPEFEYRLAHAAAGRFITADILSANGDRSLEALLRERLPGFGSTMDARSSLPNAKCAVDIYLNGLRYLGAFDGIQPRELRGVEYYQAGSAPVKYRRAFSTCPIVLFWLK